MTSPDYADPTVVTTRYRRAAQEWDDRMGDALVRARNWRFVALVALAGMVLSNAGTLYLGTLPKSVPYIIELDGVGQATFRGELGRVATAGKPSDRQVQYQLRRFVQALRSVSSDARMTKQLWSEAMQM